jgi:two-component system response regulator MprA
MRILVVDDDAATIDILSHSLLYEGYSVDVARDSAAALEFVRQQPPDLILLGSTLPGASGIETTRELRALTDSSIILLTAGGTVGERVQGLDSGADDILVKPFSLDELLARIRAVLRRRGLLETDQALTFSKLRLDPTSRAVSYNGAPLELSAKEFNILELLMRSPRQVINRLTFYERIWGYSLASESNMLEVYISNLRNKLEKAGAGGLLQTMRGAGYVLREPNL